MTEPTVGSGPSPSAEPVIAWENPRPPAGPAPGVEFAGHGPRFVAYLIDSLILFAIIAASLLAVVAIGAAIDRDLLEPSDVRESSPAIALFVAWVVVLLVVTIGYFPWFWARGGQTPGMRPFRLWVVRDRDGAPIGGRTAILRILGLYVASSVLYLGLIWIFIDKRRRGWHDLIAGTVVIHRTGGRAT